MDTYDNVTPMQPRTNGEQTIPRFNIKALSLFSEDGHLTVTFWLLCAAIVVAVYLVIETLSVDDTPEPTIVPNLGQNNHSTPTPAVVKRSKPTTEPVAKEQD
jgi:hypothetical protein